MQRFCCTASASRFAALGLTAALACIVGLQVPATAAAAPQLRHHRAGKLDRDGDGLSNWTELRRTRTNPRRKDTDRDGLSDWTEVKRTKTNPRRQDTDGDGFTDREEVGAGSDPRDPDSTPASPEPPAPEEPTVEGGGGEDPAPAPEPAPEPPPEGEEPGEEPPAEEPPVEEEPAGEPPLPPASSGCVEGATTVTSASQLRSAVQAGEDVCVTAEIGNLDLSGLGSRPVVVSTDGGSIGAIGLSSTTDLTIAGARFRSITLRGSHRTKLLDNTIGGSKTNRVYDQLIFMPETNDDVRIEGNDIGWTLADSSGNTGYGCRCYGTLNRLRFVGNRLHDLAGDGFQGVGGEDVLIDRNEIGPVGRNPGSNEHSDNIQITGNGANLRITNNWLHHQGYYEGEPTANAGSTYIHGGSDSSLIYENNLIETAQGRTEICGLGTGGTARSKITIRRNTWVDGGRAFTDFPGFEWDCDSGSDNLVERNIAIDPDGGFAQDGSAGAAIFSANLWGQPSLVTLDADGNCTSANCNPAGGEPIGYRKPSGVSW
ncbi:MAG TPA: hypothetical protein VH703_01085 [Solirubrobacterales bacterium]|jgi:hypothetical protein